MMDAHRTSTAEACLAAAYDGSLDFPTIVGRLIEAGFEGYTVDYRRGTSTYYLPDGDSVALHNPGDHGPVAATFQAPVVEAAVREAQMLAPGYTYAGFGRQATAAGCAGYIVSFSGRRVVYFGRTAELHVEHFPQ
jgi:uncharacterized protein YbcV (DUF1398 family)